MSTSMLRTCIFVCLSTTAVAVPAGDTAALTPRPEERLHSSAVHSSAATQKASPIKYILLLSTQRGASTSLALELGTHKCVVDINEVLMGNDQAPHAQDEEGKESIESAKGTIFSDVMLQEYVPKSLWQHRTTHFSEFLKHVHKGFCKRDRADETDTPVEGVCKGSCVMVLKIHNHVDRDSLRRLLRDRSTAVVVSERKELRDEECSLAYSEATGIWHIGSIFSADSSSAKAAWMKKHCDTSQPASPSFVRNHESWFSWCHNTLAQLHKPYLNMTFDHFVANPKLARNKILKFAGLDPAHTRAMTISDHPHHSGR